MSDLKKMIEELGEVLFQERELIVTENFAEYPELVARKEGLLQTINETVSGATFNTREEKGQIEVSLKEMLEVNRGNMYLLYNYRLYHKDLARVLCQEEEGQGSTPYGKKDKGSNSYFDTQA